MLKFFKRKDNYLENLKKQLEMQKDDLYSNSTADGNHLERLKAVQETEQKIKKFIDAQKEEAEQAKLDEYVKRRKEEEDSHYGWHGTDDRKMKEMEEEFKRSLRDPQYKMRGDIEMEGRSLAGKLKKKRRSKKRHSKKRHNKKKRTRRRR